MCCSVRRKRRHEIQIIFRAALEDVRYEDNSTSIYLETNIYTYTYMVYKLERFVSDTAIFTKPIEMQLNSSAKQSNTCICICGYISLANLIIN